MTAVLTPPDDDEALRQIDDFLHQSGPQSTGSRSSEERPDPRRILLYEEGESDHIMPRSKKKFLETTGASFASSYSHRVPTQDELQEPRSPKEPDQEVLELFYPAKERFLPQYL